MLNFLKNEGKAFKEVKKFRSKVEPKLESIFEKIRISSREEAIVRGLEIINKVLELIGQHISLANTDPGHGIGHWMRDMYNGLRLCLKLDADPRTLFVGLVAGALHDIGCAVVPRYHEPQRAIRHAEAGALLLLDLFYKDSFGLNEAGQLLICYAIAAHTHYLEEQKVKCKDGVIRVIKPYKDTINGKPFYPVWLPRWIDRLECNGPYFVARHYLTLHEPHRDFNGENQSFYEVNFAETMRPIIRSREEIKKAGGKRTMLEHLKMFMDSQNNESPYGKHDYGYYVKLRKDYKEKLNRIIKAVLHPELPTDENIIMVAWRMILEKTEPINGREAAKKLESLFNSLNEKTKFAWLSGFHAAMREIVNLDTETTMDINRHMPKDIFEETRGIFQEILQK